MKPPCRLQRVSGSSSFRGIHGGTSPVSAKRPADQAMKCFSMPVNTLVAPLAGSAPCKTNSSADRVCRMPMLNGSLFTVIVIAYYYSAMQVAARTTSISAEPNRDLWISDDHGLPKLRDFPPMPGVEAFPTLTITHSTLPAQKMTRA